REASMPHRAQPPEARSHRCLRAGWPPYPLGDIIPGRPTPSAAAAGTRKDRRSLPERPLRSRDTIDNAPVAQPDRVVASEAIGRGFESLQARHLPASRLLAGTAGTGRRARGTGAGTAAGSPDDDALATPVRSDASRVSPPRPPAQPVQGVRSAAR